PGWNRLSRLIGIITMNKKYQGIIKEILINTKQDFPRIFALVEFRKKSARVVGLNIEQAEACCRAFTEKVSNWIGQSVIYNIQIQADGRQIASIRPLLV
ncbi:MAG: hypothetical protein AAF696_34750, partial [Bacteroidota bacterium]